MTTNIGQHVVQVTVHTYFISKIYKIDWRTIISKLYLSDLGEGWAPTVIGSEEELAFIRGGEIGNNVPNTYYLGGSTDADTDTTLQYSDYITDRSGNVIAKQGYYTVYCFNK